MSAAHPKAPHIQRKRITERTRERVHRLAYDFEDLARRARADGLISLADTFQATASSLGNVARDEDRWKRRT